MVADGLGTKRAFERVGKTSGLGVRRLTLQPGGTDGSPLHGGACHGQMGTVSGPPRRYDRGGATQLFLRLMGSDDTPHLEMPRGVGVRRLTL